MSIKPKEIQRPFEIGTKVRFTQAYLASSSENHRQRFQDRTGAIHGYRMGANDPTVVFLREGRRHEVKLFEIQKKYLEVVLVAEK